MDNKIKKRSSATLNVYSQTLSAEELMQLVPFQPDWSKQKGTPRGRDPDNVHPHSVIAFDSHLDPSASPEAHIADLLGRLSPARDALRTFAQRARSEVPHAQLPSGRLLTPVLFWLTVDSMDGTIGFDISSEQLRTIADLGADFAVELEIDDEAPNG